MLSFFTNYKNPYRISDEIFEKRDNKFSTYLPYAAYDPDADVYYNKDDSMGFMFLCSPRINGGDELEKNIASMLNMLSGIPGSVLSFTLVSSPFIRDTIDWYKRLKERTVTDPLLKMATDKYADFLLKGVKGLPHMLGVPIRNFELYVSFKMPEKEAEKHNVKELKASFFESLKGSYLNPRKVEPDMLIRFLFMLFNGRPDKNARWDQGRFISDQIILADTKISVEKELFHSGPNYFACITPKHIAPEVSLDKTGKIIGEDRGPIDDSNQIPCHFMFTTVYSYDSKIANLIRSKAAFFKRQSEGEDSILNRTIGQYASEHLEAVDKLEKGRKYIYSMPLLWLWDESKEKLKSGVERVKRLMSRQGFVPQVEDMLVAPLFIAALPFGLYPDKNNLQQLERYFLATEEESAALAPVVADYQGGGSPQMFFISRKGQLISFDPFDKTARNKNLCVMGTTGGGKSFTLNLFVLSMFASGAIVRIFDLGYSYQKLCRLLKGDYIDPSERKICLNPFTFVPKGCKGRELTYHMDNIAALMGIAAYADTDEEPTQDMKNLLRGAVQYAWEMKKNDADISLVYDYLAYFPKLTGPELKELCKDKGSRCRTDLAKAAHHLAFNLTNWLPGGIYEEWFVGKANVDLVSSPFIVFEFEHLRRTPALLNVVSLAVVNATTAVMYLMPRDTWKVVVFEECGVVLKGNELFKTVVEEAYRRGRKNNVSTATVFQSPLDLQKLGAVGDVIQANADFHMYLPSPDYTKAIREKVLPLEGCEELLNSINSARPRYSEIGLKTPYGVGVGRVLVNSFMYWLATSDPADWTTIQKRIQEIREQRNNRRFDVNIQAFVIQKGKKMNIVNLSREGCLIQDIDEDPLPPSSIVDFEANMDGPVKIRGEVVHTGKGDVMGLKFVHFHDGKENFDRFMRRIEDENADDGLSSGALIRVIEELEEERDRKMLSAFNNAL